MQLLFLLNPTDMNTVRSTIYKNRPFLIGSVIFLIISLVFGGLYSKSDCFLTLNFFHTHPLDQFFIYYTLLGDGWIVLALFISFLFFRRALLSIHLILAYLSSGIAAQLIKYVAPAPRPKVFLESTGYANFIEGITRGGWSSFPSGHTATAFAVATILALHAKNKSIGLVYLLLAIGVGYSRVYLGHHFLEDVTGGAMIGLFFAGWIYLAIGQVRLLRWEIRREPAMAIQS